MKKYNFKLIITFVLSYALLVVIGVFSYAHISNNYITNLVKKNLSASTQIVGQRIDYQIDFDFHKLESLIEKAINEGLDPIDELSRNKDTIKIGEQNYIAFGTTLDSSVIVGTETWEYTAEFLTIDYDQPVAIYTLNQAFGIDNQTPYIFFRVDNYIAFFDASLYLTSLSSEIQNSNFAIMSSDNSVVFHNFYNSEIRFLFDELRASGESEKVVTAVKDALENNESHVVQAGFLGQNSFITFEPLDPAISTNNYYLVMVFDEEVSFAAVGYLTDILFGVFLGVFALFAITMFILYNVLESKLDDIENSRIRHYYSKPFIIKINAKGKIKNYNKSFKKLLGDYDTYKKVDDFKIRKEANSDSIEETIKKQRPFTAFFSLDLNKVVYVRFVPVRTAGGYLLIGHDSTDIEGEFEEYRDLALFDEVTHLPNLNSIKIDLSEVLESDEDIVKNNSLVAFNIVAFDKIMLLLGEKSRQRLLVLISKLTKSSLDGYPATLYNLKNDTFVVLFKDIENYKWIDRWIEKLLNVFEEPLAFENIFTEINVKVGVFHIDSKRYELLNTQACISNMMLALRHATESIAHTQFVYDVGLSVVASRNELMEKDLAQAIINNEFKMVLQAQYDNELEKIVGFEALIRWKNPKYASESPLKFIQLAEKNNMIIDIGRIALHETFQIAKELEQYDIHISINISPVQILQSGFVNEVIEIFEQYELKKNSISLEITETFLIDSFELVINKLRLLQRYGFDIHLDDFGTGYSSLQYLSQLPINTLKIDRAFIINLVTDPHSRAIVAMISKLAKEIGLEVISEGIENDKQNQIVYKSGCDIIQGYLIGPAVEKNEAIKLIEAYNINKSKTVLVKKNIKRKEIKR